MARRALRGIWLGRRRYAPVYALQESLRESRTSGAEPDTVLLLEHEPVITLGRGARAEHLLASEAFLSSRGIELARTDRGGDVTVHAPGQLVAYPILDLSPDRRDVRRYVNDLAETMRRVAKQFGVDAGTVPGLVGLWVDPTRPGSFSHGNDGAPLAKLGAIGVRIARWVTMHGFALNLSPDLGLFGLIVPCGISEHGVTSIEALTGATPSVRDVAELSLTELASVLDARVAGLDDWSRRASLDEAVAPQRG